MKNLWFILVLVLFWAVIPVSSQGHHYGGGHHGLWPGTLDTLKVSGTVIVDTEYIMHMYYLDTDNNGQPDYHLSFGPIWYTPESGAEHPQNGDVITITGVSWGQTDQYITLIVLEINGLIWRQAFEGNMTGWDGSHFWQDIVDEITISGIVQIDSTYYYVHYYLDTDNNTIPDYQLNFGPPWYLEQQELQLPVEGENITVSGALHNAGMMDVPGLMVFKVNGVLWRDPAGPPPWVGNWLHKDSDSTEFVFCPTDSLDWMSHPVGSMMGMMGSSMFPDSIYCQFEELHPVYLPGEYDSTLFAGYYMNMYTPSGSQMMGGMGMAGGMRFNRQTLHQFHYDESHLEQMHLTEQNVKVYYWDEMTNAWQAVSNVQLDTESNTLTFESYDMNTYYALSGSAVTTDIDEIVEMNSVPVLFSIQPNYPNPFNPETHIQFEIEKTAHVQIKVYDILGHAIRTLLNNNVNAGTHTVDWNGQDDSANKAASGIYFLEIKVGNQSQIQKMTLVQ